MNAEIDDKRQMGITWAKYRRFHSYALCLFTCMIIYDANEGGFQRNVFEIGSPIVISICSVVLCLVLNYVALVVMVIPFYKAGGRSWTAGGREQFALVHGFSVQTYVPILIQILTICLLRYVHCIVVLNPILSTYMISIIVTACICYVVARIIFRK